MSNGSWLSRSIDGVSALCLFFLAIAIVLRMPGPFTHADEGSYLVAAMGLVHGIHPTPVWGYHLGYSAIFAPAALISTSPSFVYHAALVANCIMLAGMYLLWIHLCRVLLPSLSVSGRRLVSLFAIVQPAVFPFTVMAMTEVAFTFFMLAAIVSSVRYAQKAQIATLLVASFCWGYLYTITPRGAVAAAPFLIFLGAAIHRTGASRTKKVISLLAMIGAFSLACLITRLLAAAADLPPNTASGYSFASITKVFEPGFLKNMLQVSLGMASAGAMLSFGLPFMMPLKVFKEGAFELRAILIASYGALFLTLGLSAYFFASVASTVDIGHTFYARYLCPIVAFVSALSLGIMLTPGSNFSLKSGALGLVLVGLVVLLSAQLVPVHERAAFNWLNTPSFVMVKHVPGAFHLFLATVVTLVMSLVCMVGLRYSKLSGAPVLVIASLIIAGVFYVSYAKPQADHVEHYRYVEKYLYGLQQNGIAEPCVTIGSGLAPWTVFDMRFYLARFLESWKGRSCNASLEVASSVSAVPPNRVVVFRDSAAKIQITVAAESKKALIDKGGMTPEDWPTVRHEALAGGRLLISAPQERGLVGSKRGVDVLVENNSKYYWPISLGSDDGFRVGVLYLANARRVERRFDFGRPMFPGSRVLVHVNLERKLLKGTNKVCIGLLEEHVAWASPDSGGLTCWSLR